MARDRSRRKVLYDYDDASALQDLGPPQPSLAANLSSIDELLERDKQREKDGFPRKVSIGRLIRPGKPGKGTVVVVPTTVEEKFIHDPTLAPTQEGQTGGKGEGEEGDIIGEQPVHSPNGEGAGPGEGDDALHEIESTGYDLGKILTEKFELPNLKDKGKKSALARYTYDITDRNRGFGQIVDKKATLRQILETNLGLGRVPDVHNIDAGDLLVSPRDTVYRTLSREKDYESQAMVFFLRDYSASMAGKCTELVVSQHVLIYSWLLYQYERRVETRFVLHDTEAKEVPDFYTYHNLRVAGGTQVYSAYALVNEIVEKENLAPDYNIYVFHGTDGDDWDTKGEKAVPELRNMLKYANRVGITVVRHAHSVDKDTEVEKYLDQSGLLKEMPDLLQIDSMSEDAVESRLIEGIKQLLSQKPSTH